MARFSLDKVLSCSLRDYVYSRLKRPSDYEIRGIHGRNEDDFLKNVPENVEVVTDFKIYVSGGHYCGTALIPATLADMEEKISSEER